jgi:hypothetical protein
MRDGNVCDCVKPVLSVYTVANGVTPGDFFSRIPFITFEAIDEYKEYTL